MWGVFVIYIWTRPGLPVRSPWLPASRVHCSRRTLCAGSDPMVRCALRTPFQSGVFRRLGEPARLRMAGAVGGLHWGRAALPCFVVGRWVGLHLFHLYTGPTADGQMFLLDDALGDPAYAVGQWLLPHPRLRAALWHLRHGRALNAAHSIWCGGWRPHSSPMSACILGGGRRVERPAVHALSRCGTGLRLSPVAVPTDGVTGAPLDVPAGLERTGMPSLHLTWVLLAWYFAPRTPRWVRPLLALFVGTTVVATLGLGQHFLVDLIAAIPYTAAVAWLVTRFIRPTLRFEAQGEAPPSAAHDAA